MARRRNAMGRENSRRNKDFFFCNWLARKDSKQRTSLMGEYHWSEKLYLNTPILPIGSKGRALLRSLFFQKV